MSTKRMKSTFLANIPSPLVDGKKLTNISSICNDGYTAYALKTCGSSSDNLLYPIAIYKIEKFTTKPKVTLINVKKNNKIYRNCRHANDITFADGYLYIATMNNKDRAQLVKISINGTVKKEYMYDKGGNSAFHTCTYYGKINGKLYFIVNISGGDGVRRYNLVHIEGDKVVFDKGFHTKKNEIPEAYTANAIYYDPLKKRFYNTFFTKNSKGKIKTCYLNSYKINDIFTTDEISINNQYIVAADSNYTEKFELEALTMVDNKKYIVCNCGSSKGGKYNEDGLFKITE